MAYAPLADLYWSLVISAWAWTMGTHLFSALPDIDVDRSAQVKTTAVWLGHKYATLLTPFYFITAVALTPQTSLMDGPSGIRRLLPPYGLCAAFVRGRVPKPLKAYKVFLQLTYLWWCIFVYIFLASAMGPNISQTSWRAIMLSCSMLMGFIGYYALEVKDEYFSIIPMICWRFLPMSICLEFH